MDSNTFIKNPFVWIGGGIILLLILCMSAERLPLTHSALITQTEVISITEPSHLQRFYGTLDSLPHTYEFQIGASSTFDARILVPGNTPEDTVVSAILVKEPIGKGRVTEIARLNASRASWNRAYLWSLGTSLTEGPSFHAMLGPGVYHLEVHTPNNRELYLLEVGSLKQNVGYVTFVRQLIPFMHFVGNSLFGIVLVPSIFLALVLIGLMSYALYLCRSKRG